MICYLFVLIALSLQGKIPSHSRAVFFSAKLCALRKKCGGVRPIAVGNTFRRLAAKVGIAAMSDHLSSIFNGERSGSSQSPVNSFRLPLPTTLLLHFGLNTLVVKDKAI